MIIEKKYSEIYIFIHKKESVNTIKVERDL